MNKHYSTAIVLAITTLVGACSSGPRTTGLLDQTRSDYRMAQGNPHVASYAALEMKQASDAMAQANAAANDNDSAEKVDKLAYLAKQQIALTQEVAKQKAAEAQVANAGKERDQIRLQQRTNEAIKPSQCAASSTGRAGSPGRSSRCATPDTADPSRSSRCTAQDARCASPCGAAGSSIGGSGR